MANGLAEHRACRFEHLGGVYALGVDGGSQDVIEFNSTFLDISGGGLKLGSSGERGILQPQNNESLPVEEQDRGFLVSDNVFTGIPVEYSGANPVFAGYVADTLVDHNSIHDSSYSGASAGSAKGRPPPPSLSPCIFLSLSSSFCVILAACSLGDGWRLAHIAQEYVLAGAGGCQASCAMSTRLTIRSQNRCKD